MYVRFINEIPFVLWKIQELLDREIRLFCAICIFLQIDMDLALKCVFE